MKSFFIALTVVLISSAAVASGGPAMTVGSASTELSQEDCMTKAARVMRNIGYTQNFEKLSKTIYGESGTYTAAIRCEAASKLVIFIVAGPVSKITDAAHAKLKETFAAP